jgi:prepilin-type N-terminal cleavage/methylation domain-containing protein
MSRRNLNSGFTIIEVLVSLFMMSIVLYITGQTLNIILKRMGLESRLATAVVEAKQVTNVLLT